MPFASSDDVEARLGRELTPAEGPMVTFLLEAGSEVVAQAADTEASLVDPVPPILKYVVVEVVARAMSNPQGLASNTTTLGEWSHSQTFRKELSSDLFLTTSEETLVRRAIIGQLSGTADTQSIANDPVVMQTLAPSSTYFECEGS